MPKKDLIKNIDAAIASDEISDSTKEVLNQCREELSKASNIKEIFRILIRLISLMEVSTEIYSNIDKLI